MINETKYDNSDFILLKLKTGEEVMVDIEDYERLMERVWILRKSENRKPQVISMIWDKAQGKIITTYLAREIIQETQKVVVRKNLEGLDFRKSNLLVVTRKEKERMRAKTEIKTTSKYKGVAWRKQSNKWSATICVNDKRKYLGLYSSEKEAAQIYNDAAKKYFNEFAFQNKIE